MDLEERLEKCTKSLKRLGLKVRKLRKEKKELKKDIKEQEYRSAGIVRVGYDDELAGLIELDHEGTPYTDHSGKKVRYLGRHIITETGRYEYVEHLVELCEENKADAYRLTESKRTKEAGGCSYACETGCNCRTWTEEVTTEHTELYRRDD